MKARCAVLLAAVFLFAGVLGVSAQSWEDFAGEFRFIMALTGASDVSISWRASDDFQAEWPLMPYLEKRKFPLNIFEIGETLYVGAWFSEIEECPLTVDLALNDVHNDGAIALGLVTGDMVGGNAYAMLIDTSRSGQIHYGWMAAKRRFGCH